MLQHPGRRLAQQRQQRLIHLLQVPLTGCPLTLMLTQQQQQQQQQHFVHLQMLPNWNLNRQHQRSNLH
jgi:hypothetical protein